MKRRAGKKKVVLELGSNAAVIVDEGADLSFAVPRIVYGSYSYAGQKCISVQRLYVHEAIYGAFCDRFVEASRKVKCGDPRDPEVLIGPMVNRAAADRLESWIAEAKARGAEVLLDGPRRGNVLPPTILARVPADAKVSCEEAFGPVVTIEPYRDFEAALHRVDDSTFGLQAGVFTEQIDRAFRAFEALEMGGVIVNDIPTFRVDSMPYGGVKNSGLGREGIRYAMEDMTEIRVLVLNFAHHA
jgi:acyl-CoA reductase-like NAD-dependent aldehyde dehydrogenase